MTTAVFRNASHALHVSYLITSMPATTRSPTAIVIDQLVKANHVWDGLPPPEHSQVNFSGLSPLEVRLQCAQVVSMVNHLQHPAERHALEAIYGQQVVKAQGVRGMAAYCGPAVGLSDTAMLYLGWHVYARAHQRDGITQQSIASEFGLTLAKVRSATDTIKRYGQNLHGRAIDALTGRFLAGGLIDAE